MRQPDDPAERRRYLEINGALTRCAELYSAALARSACVPVVKDVGALWMTA
jgi:hypothetical protein